MTLKLFNKKRIFISILFFLIIVSMIFGYHTYIHPDLFHDTFIEVDFWRSNEQMKTINTNQLKKIQSTLNDLKLTKKINQEPALEGGIFFTIITKKGEFHVGLNSNQINVNETFYKTNKNVDEKIYQLLYKNPSISTSN